MALTQTPDHHPETAHGASGAELVKTHELGRPGIRAVVDGGANLWDCVPIQAAQGLIVFGIQIPLGYR